MIGKLIIFLEIVVAVLVWMFLLGLIHIKAVWNKDSEREIRFSLPCLWFCGGK